MMSRWKPTIDFIRSIYGQDGFVPLHAPVFRGNEKKYLTECIDTTFVSSVGKFVDRFEEMCAEYTGAKFAVAAVNGTAALQVALKLCGVQSGDEVVTQALTFVATANAISHSGAIPVFVDVDRSTLGMSPVALAAYLDEHCQLVDGECRNMNTGRVVRACVPMHTFGHPCRIVEIQEICARFNLALVEDAAESLGSFCGGKHTGTFGRCGVLSFNGNKTITTGGGGIILTDDEDLAMRAKHLTTTAKIPHPWKYEHDVVAFNFRLTNLAAAVGCAQMEELDGILAAKRDLAERYRTFFAEEGLEFIQEPNDARSNYWLNALLLDSVEARDDFLRESAEREVMTRPAWELMTDLDMFAECPAGPLENSRLLQDCLVNIPSSVP